jgi:type IV pilus assembly protein PilC
MAFFKFKVINKEYEKESGTIEAVSEEQAESLLSSRGYQIISIQKIFSTQVLEKYFVYLFHRVSTKDLVIFFRQFSVLVSSNITLIQSLRILSEQVHNSVLKTVLTEISNDVDSGDRLSDALAKQSRVFSSFHVSVIRSGEKSGKLDESLEYLASEEERIYDITKKVRGALMYPAIVVSAMIIVGVLMMIFVVPKLIDIFAEVGGELPIMTRVLIAVSDFLVGYWWVAVIGILAVVIIAKAYARQPWGKRQLDIIILHLPIIGGIISRMSVIHFTRSMGTLLTGGITVSNSLKVSRGIVNNTVFKDLISRTIVEVEEGKSVSNVFTHSKEMPVMVSRMMAIGEKTGKLDFVLDKVADFYDKELQNILDNLLILLEPIIIILMAVIVGFMAAAIILPMYNLTSQF